MYLLLIISFSMLARLCLSPQLGPDTHWPNIWPAFGGNGSRIPAHPAPVGSAVIAILIPTGQALSRSLGSRTTVARAISNTVGQGSGNRESRLDRIGESMLGCSAVLLSVRNTFRKGPSRLPLPTMRAIFCGNNVRQSDQLSNQLAISYC